MCAGKKLCKIPVCCIPTPGKTSPRTRAYMDDVELEWIGEEDIDIHCLMLDVVIHLQLFIAKLGLVWCVTSTESEKLTNDERWSKTRTVKQK